jgi:hypothetical protein
MSHSSPPSIHYGILSTNSVSLMCGLLWLFGCDTGRLLAVADETIPNGSGGTHQSSNTLPNGGTSTGGSSTGGSSTGGSPTGGSSTEGSPTGGSPTGGSSTDGPKIPNCGQVGSLCGFGFECCSGACAKSGILDINGEDLPRCQSISGCRPAGEICNSNIECCSGICTSNGSVQVCALTKTDCQSQGEPCGLPQPDMGKCCSDIKQNTRSCAPTNAGVYQCLNIVPNGEPAPDGAPCITALDCRSWFCVPTNGGATVCSPNCGAIGQACRASSDCCINSGPAACINEQCQPVNATCRQLGQPCASPSDCCNGNCKLINGRGFCVTGQ